MRFEVTPPPPTTRTAELIENAAALIEHDGWIQNDQWPGAGRLVPYRPGLPLCLMGALNISACGELIDQNALFIAASFLSRLLQREYGITSLINFNDNPSRVASEVIDFLNLAAKEIRNNVSPTLTPRAL